MAKGICQTGQEPRQSWRMPRQGFMILMPSHAGVLSLPPQPFLKYRHPPKTLLVRGHGAHSGFQGKILVKFLVNWWQPLRKYIYTPINSYSSTNSSTSPGGFYPQWPLHKGAKTSEWKLLLFGLCLNSSPSISKTATATPPHTVWWGVAAIPLYDGIVPQKKLILHWTYYSTNMWFRPWFSSPAQLIPSQCGRAEPGGDLLFPWSDGAVHRAHLVPIS